MFGVAVPLPRAIDCIALGRRIAKALPQPPVTVWMWGHVGAGKTTFAKGFVSELTGLSEREVSSPSYLLDNQYEALDGMPVHHMDLYRLSKQPLEALDLENVFNEAYSLIEWPDRITLASEPANCLHTVLCTSNFPLPASARPVSLNIYESSADPVLLPRQACLSEAELPPFWNSISEGVFAVLGAWHADALVEEENALEKMVTTDQDTDVESIPRFAILASAAPSWMESLKLHIISRG